MQSTKYQYCGRNPYFIGINSAIEETHKKDGLAQIVAILILLELTLQYKNGSTVGHTKIQSQSLFYWN